jgi:hypothetical protein
MACTKIITKYGNALRSIGDVHKYILNHPNDGLKLANHLFMSNGEIYVDFAKRCLCQKINDVELSGYEWHDEIEIFGKVQRNSYVHIGLLTKKMDTNSITSLME